MKSKLLKRAYEILDTHEVHKNLSVIILAVPIDEFIDWKQDYNSMLIKESENADRKTEK